MVYNSSISDIGANLTDAMYSGVYNGSKKHEPDMQQVLERSWSAGLRKIIITAGNLEESKKALDFANSDGKIYDSIPSQWRIKELRGWGLLLEMRPIQKEKTAFFQNMRLLF